MKGWSTSPLWMDTRFSLLPHKLTDTLTLRLYSLFARESETVSFYSRCVQVVDIMSCSKTGIMRHGSNDQTLCTLLASIIASLFGCSKQYLPLYQLCPYSISGCIPDHCSAMWDSAFLSRSA